MSAMVKVRNIVLGEGMPKICVPIVGRSKEEVLLSAENIVSQCPDLIEWRIDFLSCIREKETVKQIALQLRKVIKEIPLLVTFRTKREGGEAEYEKELYQDLYEMMMDEKVADLIDVEVFLEQDTVKNLIRSAKEKKVVVIGSNHEFFHTPEKEEIIKRLCRMQELGMDIAKMAVMPQSTADLLTLLDATRVMKEEHSSTPVITMSMSGKGALSRITGEIFGSALTFATVGKASAPGQIPIAELRSVMQVVHGSCI